MDSNKPVEVNRATRAIVVTFGVIFAVSGMSHGFFEILQGNTPTNGLVISAIDEEHRMWIHGAEGAFTIVPNFLITGVLAISVSIVIIVWSVGFVHRKRGPIVLLLLFVLLFLVGGGVAQSLFFILMWAGATRIDKPLSWWRKVLPVRLRPTLAKTWKASLIASSLLFLVALGIAIFGYVPGWDDPDQVLILMLIALISGTITLIYSFIAGFSSDIIRSGQGAGGSGMAPEFAK
jgi:hypothetical protein